MAKKAKIVLPIAPLPDLMLWWKSQQVRRVRRWVRAFADTLESPEIFDELDRRLRRRPPRKRGKGKS